MAAETDLVSYYARRAREYDKIYLKPERQSDLRRLALLLVDALRDRQVLEIACGTGYWTEIAARSALHIDAVDINDEVLAIARSRGVPSGKATFARGDAYALQPINKSYTAGFAAFWWSHVPKAQLAAFLRQFHAVLSPGACVVFLDNNFVVGSSTPLTRRDMEGNTYQQRKLEDGSVHEVLKNFPDAADLEAAVAANTDVPEIHLLDYYWLLSYNLKPT